MSELFEISNYRNAEIYLGFGECCVRIMLRGLWKSVKVIKLIKPCEACLLSCYSEEGLGFLGTQREH